MVRLLGLPLRELRDLCLAQWFLLAARSGRSRAPTGRYVALDASEPRNGFGAGLLPRDRAVAARLALAVARAAEHGVIRPTCLERAVALQALLRHQGMVGSRIRVGVRWERGEFLAHAWVEMEDTILADTPGRVRAFTCIAQTETSRP